MSVEQVGTGEEMRPASRAFIGYWFLILLLAPIIGAPETMIELVYAEIGKQLPSEEGMGGLAGLLRSVAAMLVVAIYVMQILIPRMANRYQITEDRIIEINGIIKKDQNTTELAHIRRVNAKVGYVGRLMQMLGLKGYGDLICYTAGSGDEDITMFGILDPGKVEVRMRELIAENLNPGGGHTGGSPSGSSGSAGSTQDTAQTQELKSRMAMLEQRIAYLEHHVRGSEATIPEAQQGQEPRSTDADDEESILGANVSGGHNAQQAEPIASAGERRAWESAPTPSSSDSEKQESSKPVESEEDYQEPTPKMFGTGGDLDKAPAREGEKKKKGSGGESVGFLMDED